MKVSHRLNIFGESTNTLPCRYKRELQRLRDLQVSKEAEGRSKQELIHEMEVMGGGYRGAGGMSDPQALKEELRDDLKGIEKLLAGVKVRGHLCTEDPHADV